MSDYVYENGSLPSGKADGRPLSVPANKGVTASEWNTVMAALDSLRSAVLSGQFHGFLTGGSANGKFAMRTAIPSTGVWTAGDIVLDTSTTLGMKGWVCSVSGDFAGSPHPTFVAFTNSGDITLAALGSSPNANGASLSGQALTLQPADASHPGAVSTGNQVMGAGDKTFAGNVGIGVTPGEKLHVLNGNLLFEAAAEAAMKFKRQGAVGSKNNPIFQFGRIIPAGIGLPEIRVLYADDSESERIIFAQESSGTVAIIGDLTRRSKLEGYDRNGATNPSFRLTTYPQATLELGPGDVTAVAGQVTRSGTTVTVHTSATHEFATGDSVAVTPNGGDVGPLSSGPFTVTVTDSTHFHYTDGSGTYTSVADAQFSAETDAKLRRLGQNQLGVVIGAYGSEQTKAIFYPDSLVLQSGVALNVGGGSQSPAALAQIDSTTKGFLPPRMTRAQRDAISSPPAGLVIYNSDSKRHECYDGTRWQSRSILELSSGGPSDTTDRTSDLQAALAEGGHIYLGPGQYMIKDHLDLLSNTRLTLHPQAVLKRDPTMPVQTQMIRMVSVSFVLIEGGTIDGNKANGFSGHGQCTGIATGGAQDILIRDCLVKDWPVDITGGSYGYGIYLGSGATLNQRIKVSNVVVTNCDQNDMFLVAGVDITIENSTFSDAQGSTPGSGLDIEPNAGNERIQHVLVKNCIFERCSYGVTANNHYGGYWHDVQFVDCVFQHNRAGGFYTGGGDTSFTGGVLASGLRIKNCVSRYNYGDHGFRVAGWKDVLIDGCDAVGNSDGCGFDVEECALQAIKNCNAVCNSSVGFNVSSSATRDFKLSITDCAAFNNGTYGITVELSIPGYNTNPTGVHVALNRTGNAVELMPQSWAASTAYYDDFRVQNDGKIYELVTPGTSASSGGPSGTGSSISDGSCVWKYVMTPPSQDWGLYVFGEGARGVVCTRNMNFGNNLGLMREHPSGDANTLFMADILESQFSGQAGSPLTRTRSVAFKDHSGTPGDIGTYYGAGIAAIPKNTADLNYKSESVPFTTGDLVTGATSGATGTVASLTSVGSTGTLRMTSVTGMFLDGETLNASHGGVALADGYAMATCIVNTPFAAVGDGVTITPQALDPVVSSLMGVVISAGNILVRGFGAPQNDLPFFFEVIKKGTFVYDLVSQP